MESPFLTRNLCASVCRQCVRRRDRAENRAPGQQPAHPAAQKLPFRQNGDSDHLQKPLALQLPAGTSAQVRHRHSPSCARTLLPRSVPTLPSDFRGFCPFFKLFSSSLCPRWLKGNRTRAEDMCSTPAQQRGQPIRDSLALRSCKLPTKRSRKGSRH